MPTDAQLMAELKRRGLGPKQDDDEQLRQELARRGLSQPQAQPSEGPSRVESGALGALQGATLGFADELMNLNPFAPGAGNRLRQRTEQAREAHPVVTGAGELAGGLATGGVGGVRAAAGQAGRAAIGRLAGAGAATGGAAGVGYADEGERVRGGLTGAAVGGGVGAAIPGVGAAARRIVPEFLGLTSGAGPEAIKVAVKAGREGGEQGQLFVDSMRGRIPMDQVVADAKDALRSLHLDNMAKYRAGKGQVFAETAEKPIDFGAIRDTADKVFKQRTFKGVNIDPKAGSAKQELQGVLDQWQQLDPAQYHTVEGLDAMRMQVGSILDSTEFGTPARRIANETYHAISKAIEDQAPGYKDVLRQYATMKGHLDDLQRATLGSNKAATETSLRKLQLAMRDSVASAAGLRTEAVKELSEAGGGRIVPQLSGATMSSLAPRGLVGRLAAGGVGFGGLSNPAMLAGLPATSPRLVGELAHRYGQATRRSLPQGALPGGLAAYLAGQSAR